MKFKTKLKIGLGATGLAVIIGSIIGYNALQKSIKMPDPEEMFQEWSCIAKQAATIQKANPDYKGPIIILNGSNDKLKYDEHKPVQDELADKIGYSKP